MPQQVFGSGSGESGGTDSDIQNFLKLVTMRAAQDLSVDPSIGSPNRGAASSGN